MSTDEELTPEDEQILDDLIRLAREESPTEEGPDQETLLAYIQGKVSPEKRQRVQRTLEASTHLREDATYLAGLYDHDVQTRYDQAHVPTRPESEVVVHAKDRRERRHPVEDRHGHRGDGGWLKLRWGFAVIGVFLIVLLVRRPNQPVQPWLEAGQLKVDQLGGDPLRGSPSEVVLTTARERATWTLVTAVEQSGEGFHVTASRRIEVSGGRIPLGLAEAPPGELAAGIPPAGSSAGEAWFLALPSLRMYHRPLADSRSSLAWPAGEERDGVLTLTYRLNGKFEATPPVECLRR